MPDNFTNDVTELLIKLMDGELTPFEQLEAEKLLNSNAAVNEQYQLLLAAKQAIRSHGLRTQVQNIQQEYLGEQIKNQPAKVVKLSSIKIITRIAAVFFIAVAGFGIFKYVTVTPSSVFKNNYTQYQLPVNRSSETVNTTDSLYNAGKYAEAIDAVNVKANKDQNDYFIQAQSYLQLNKPGEAITAFKKVEELNNHSTEKYFVDETDYYLALAYIDNGQINAAQQKLDKIKSNKQHLFYDKAKKISSANLFILNMKHKKGG